jgi:hypothetical protein
MIKFISLNVEELSKGLVLGPLLFIIYIDDLPLCINKSAKIFSLQMIPALWSLEKLF